jgi:hypothetical protein
LPFDYSAVTKESIMNFDKTPNIYAVIVFTVLLLILSTAQIASAQSTLYDNFKANQSLNPDKWEGLNLEGAGGSTLELYRGIKGGHLVLSQQVYGDTASDEGEYWHSNSLRAPINPTALMLDGVFKDVELKGCPVPGSSVQTFGLLRIVSPLFNDGTGDVMLFLDIGNSLAYGGEADQLVVYATLYHSVADSVLGGFDLGTVAIGQRFTLWMEWLPDSNEVRFRKDNDPIGSISYAVSDEFPPWDTFTIYTEAAASNCTAQRSFAGMEVHIDNVYINP